MAWMHNLSQKIAIPHWMEFVAKFDWSSIYTSTIDETISRAFQNDWRTVPRISSTNNNPSDQTNRRKLHCTYLFGSIVDTSENEIPPFNEEDYESRLEDEAYPLLSRIRQTITPLGTLVIDTYDPDNDWLKPKQLRLIIKKLIKGQTFLFSATDSIKEIFSKEIREGKIIVFDEPLYHVLKEGEKLGKVSLENIPSEELSQIYIDIGENTINVPSNLWKTISQFAEIIDCSLFFETKQITKLENEIEFQQFIASSSNFPIWSGYIRNYPFERDYEKELQSLVLSCLKKKSIDECPIILHGQTGSGKTIALQHLAFNVSKLKHPVLFIRNGIQTDFATIRSGIEDFCEWTQKIGANKLLVVWDGMFQPNVYQKQFNILSNRGKKTVFVGSSYHLEEEKEYKYSSNNECIPIEAPVILTECEINNLILHFSTIYPDFSKILKTNRGKLSSDNFLVYLYRLLPPSRSNIHLGIVSETDRAKSNIRLATARKKITFGTSIFKSKLVEAGFSLPDDYIEDEKINYFNSSDVFTTLFHYVMVPGRLGQKVPFDLIQRTIKSNGYYELLEILENEDLFVVIEENDGNLFISPRHTLEAKIICNWDFGGPENEVGYCLKLMDSVHIINYGLSHISDEDIELKFILELVKNLGPNGPEKERYKEYYYKISQKLAELRKEKSIIIPSLILQEANLSREYIRTKSQSGFDLPEDTEKILNNSIELLTNAIFNLGRTRSSQSKNNLIEQMTVELASIKSTKIIHCLQNNIEFDISNEYKSLFSDLDKILNKSTNDEHALDVYGWSTINIIKNSSLPEIEKTKMLTQALNVIEVGETSAFGINERIITRKMSLFKLMGEEELSKDLFDKLRDNGSRIGYLWRVFENTSEISNKKSQYTDNEVEKFKENCQFLEKNRSFIKEDSGCLFQLLKSWWIMKTTRPIFNKENERQTLPFSDDDWSYCLGILEDLHQLSKLRDNASLMYIYGIVNFHLKKYETSRNAFKSIAHLDFEYGGGGGRRIIRYYLASTEDGSPKLYNGRIKSVSEDNKGLIQVDETRKDIIFFPRDFRESSLNEGDQMEPFHIAFNFISPVADPVRHYELKHN
ncbi:hypothetical protein [Methanogenium organophilum]|uniref:Uncharacterized protein n=1 Tax=Methanogenium organophilum TaxID=2199 RepID=A0A9X9S666_METOG|nr:hypothetical protein [Methanogenium organophilum]WAI02226.1 hypothetical protein OU421_04975 [Methanogenium organophilum]